MKKILVIDDTQFWREIAGDVLRSKGYLVFTAGDGIDGLASLRANGADLVLLDVEMPRLNGLSFLDQLRRETQWKNIPVIMLTGDMQKEDIIRASKLGVTDYIIKSRFDVPNLIDRVQKRLTPEIVPQNAAVLPPFASTSAATSKPALQVIKPVAGAEASGSLLSREQCIERLDRAMNGRTIAGVVAEVIACANAPRMELSHLAGLIGRDSILTARVLQTANRAAYASNRGVITTLNDAVRILGSSAVRDIAASVGVFGAMPAPEADGFSPILCWQHSIAVAMLCNSLATEEQRALAYLVGLCHNLGEVLFRTHFGAEYRKVLAAEKTSSKPRRDIERQMLSITRGELVEKILQKLELPPIIQRPIVAYHHSHRPSSLETEPLARMLMLADPYARAMMMVSSDEPALQPLTRMECRSATGREDPTAPGGSQFRSEMFAMTALYARLNAAEQAELSRTVLKRRAVRVWVAREKVFSQFDPVAAGLDALADVMIRTSLPNPLEIAEYQGLIVLSRSTSSVGFTAPDIAVASTRADGTRIPTLWLTGQKNEASPANSNETPAMVWPISLNALANFVGTL